MRNELHEMSAYLAPRELNVSEPRGKSRFWRRLTRFEELDIEGPCRRVCSPPVHVQVDRYDNIRSLERKPAHGERMWQGGHDAAMAEALQITSEAMDRTNSPAHTLADFCNVLRMNLASAKWSMPPGTDSPRSSTGGCGR
jgi:hypothetical protein